MKKNLPVILVIAFGLFVIILGIVFLFRLIGTSQKQAKIGAQEKILQAPDILDRPYVTLFSRSDGRAVIVRIAKIPRGAQIDYEITYLTEGVTQGIVGQVGLEEGQEVYEREHIFGTCSKNVCKYDKNVEFGKWNAKIDLPDRFYEIGSDWHLQRLASGKIELKDKFTIAVPGGGFSKSSYTIAHETQGMPAVLPQDTKLMAGPFHFSASEKLNKNATVSLVQKDQVSSPKIFFWDGTSWKDLGGEVKAGVISTSIDSTGTFVVASPTSE